MSPPLLFLDQIGLTFGGDALLEAAELSLGRNERIALVGRNGSGKSTLLKIAAGQMEVQSGEIFLKPGTTLRYLEQRPITGGYKTVLDYVAAGLSAGDDPYRVDYLLEQLGLTGQEDPTLLSGGEVCRAALVRALAPQPDILLLDEPTNHLDLAAIEWLENHLMQMSSAIVVISHDRKFLETVTNTTIWLDRGVTRRREIGFGGFESWRDSVLEEEEQEQHKLGRKIAREEHWLRFGVTARRKRNQRRLKELGGLRERYRTHRHAEGQVKMLASQSSTSGRLVAEAKNIAKQFGENTVVSDFSMRIRRDDKIGIAGRNGSGKTTLIKLLTGIMEPDKGSMKLGHNLQVAWIDQQRDLPDPEETVAHYLTQGSGDMLTINDQPRHVVSYMKDFLFGPEQAGTPVRELSGGERARLVLARLLSQPCNFLILDEPTNDLDLETLDLLQELIAGFDGTVLLVSHDRDFLDRTVTRMLAPDGEGRWIAYSGGYSDMMAQREGRPIGALASRAKPQSKSAVKRPDSKLATPVPGRKLSFKQKYALETLPDRISTISREILLLEKRIADPSFYDRDRKSFDRTLKSLEVKQIELNRMEENWLELELLRESLNRN